jgi:hypothetical protein
MIRYFLILFLSLAATHAKAATEGEKIAQAIQNSNSGELAAMFNSSIEMVTPSSSGIMAKEQARIVLDNFFKNNPPVKATVLHETTGTTNSMIVINLQTSKGNYRISVSGTLKGGNFVIHQFRIN